MKKTTLLIAALLASGAASADNGPLPKDLYIRGGFNGWGIDNALTYQGKGVYEASILVSPGYHGFKVGSKDWSAEWVIDPRASVTVAPGQGYKLATKAGAEDYLFVKQTALYRFRLDVSTPTTPMLSVIRLEAPKVDTINPHLGHVAITTLTFPTWDGKTEAVKFSTPDSGAALRSYAQSTSVQLRDPGPQFVKVQETTDLPRVRSGSLAFDALFALAGAEMQQNAVAEIKDGNYNGGAAIPCVCFETGEKWHYVWTRDLSYAADLGLAMLDPERVRNSLDFKLSAWRAGVRPGPRVAGSADGLQIIQDTGSGGSWPVSTDRLAWAFGAEQALIHLSPEQRKAFAPRALKALANTLENDRLAAWNKSTGLYTGEQSFLDWRDQSYAAWITGDLASMSSSMALSTNVAHYKALTLAAQLAQEQGDQASSKRYAQWARDLKKAINDRLWLPDAGMYSSLTAGHFDGSPLHKFDWLGQSLAIVTGVADGARARSILARYPHGPMGAPVIYPQQPGMPVYHNRAMWPFVTAYGLRAAAMSGNVSVADAAYGTLMRGAALNLSNMENLEWLSGQALLLDEKNPSLIGPVINSRRQLWSVGAYLGMVIGNVFGVQADEQGIRLRPFITAKLRREAFAGSDTLRLENLTLRGKRIDLRIALPAASAAEGYYSVASVRVNGKPAKPGIGWSALPDNANIEIALGPLIKGQQQMRTVTAGPYIEDASVFAPREPDGPAAEGVTRTTYRHNGCYATEAIYRSSGNRSHHSMPRCDGEKVDIPLPGAPLVNWGAAGDVLDQRVQVAQAGDYHVQLRYRNTANQINLGISGGVKWLALQDAAGKTVVQGVVQLPHTRAGGEPVYSTPLSARLVAGSYTLRVSDFYNMSYLQSNSTFSAAGGVEGPSNKFDLFGVRLLRSR